MDVDNLDQIIDDNSLFNCPRCGVNFQITGLSGVSLFCDDCSAIKSRLGISRMSSAVFVTVAFLTLIFFTLLLDTRVATDSFVSLSRFEQIASLEEPRDDMGTVMSSSSSQVVRSAAPLVTQSPTLISSQSVNESIQPNSAVKPIPKDVASAELASDPLSQTLGSTVSSPESNYRKYIVVSGDSLYAIAEQFLPIDLTLDEYTQLIRDANLMGNSDDLSIGMELLIPQIRDVSD